MNKNKITILFLAVVGMMIFGFGVKAADPLLYVSPTAVSENIGSAFDIAVKVNPAGEKICAVEGQLLFSKLAVQKIDLAEGIMPQTSPSFSNNLSFLLGIPGCTTQEKTLFTIRVKADTVGRATASFRNVDIIGEGVSVSSAFVNGNYEITVLAAPIAGTVPATPVASQISCVCSDWSSWQNGNCGEENCVFTQKLQNRVRTCAPLGCDVEKQTQCINDSTCIASASEKPEDAETAVQYSFLASIGSAITSGAHSAWLGVIVVIVLCLIGLTGIRVRQWLLSQKKK